jgi:hypothetical protein
MLQVAGTAQKLTMLAEDPLTGTRRELSAFYFERRGSRFIFHRGVFRISDLDVYDNLYPTMRHLDGWPIGYSEPEFRAWLKSVFRAASAVTAPPVALAGDVDDPEKVHRMLGVVAEAPPEAVQLYTKITGA